MWLPNTWYTSTRDMKTQVTNVVSFGFHVFPDAHAALKANKVAKNAGYDETRVYHAKGDQPVAEGIWDSAPLRTAVYHRLKLLGPFTGND